MDDLTMAGVRHAVSVDCSKVKSKSRTNAILYFSLTVTWSDGKKTFIDRSYVSIFDLMIGIKGVCSVKNIDSSHLELKAAKWFEKTHLLHQDRKAIDEFFSKVLKMPDELSKSSVVTEFLERIWIPPNKENAKNKDKTKSVEFTSDQRNSAGGASTLSSSSAESTAGHRFIILAGAYEEISVNECCEYDQLNLKPGKSLSTKTEPKMTETIEDKYLVVENYRKRKSGEVDLEEGGAVTVIQSEFSGWWFVQLDDTKEQGWAPACCLLPANRDSSAQDMFLTSLADDVPREMLTCRDYEAAGPDELSFKKGERVEVLEVRTDGWWKVRCHDQEGLIPEAYLEHLSKDAEKKDDIYRHVSLYKRSTPPPRRHLNEPIESLYARVEEIQRKKQQQNEAVNHLEDTIEEDYSYSEITPQSSTTRVALYEEIPLQPENRIPKKKNSEKSSGEAQSGSSIVKQTLCDTKAANVSSSAKDISHDTKKPLPPVPFSKKIKNKLLNPKSSKKTDKKSTEIPTLSPIKEPDYKGQVAPQIGAGAVPGAVIAANVELHKELCTQIKVNNVIETGTFRLKPVATSRNNSSPLDNSNRVSEHFYTRHKSCQAAGGASPGADVLQDERAGNHIENRHEADTGSPPKSPKPAIQVKPKQERPKPPVRSTETSLISEQKPSPITGESFMSSNTSPAVPKPVPIQSPPVLSLNGGICAAHGNSGVNIQATTTTATVTNTKATTTTSFNNEQPNQSERIAEILHNGHSTVGSSSITKSPVENLAKQPVPSSVNEKIVKQHSADKSYTVFTSSSSASDGSTVPVYAVPDNKSKHSGEKSSSASSKGNIANCVFASLVDRVKCENALQQSAKQREYIIRQSSKAGSFVISILWLNRVRHFPIQITDSKQYYIGQHSFAEISEVIDYYKSFPLFTDDHGEHVMLGDQFLFSPN